VHDPVVILTADGRELTSERDLALLGGPLGEILDTGSLEALQAAVTQAPTRNVELITHDGRVLDATVAAEAEGAVVVLRDVSNYARAAEQRRGPPSDSTTRCCSPPRRNARRGTR
jgi:hypothetical protein